MSTENLHIAAYYNKEHQTWVGHLASGSRGLCRSPDAPGPGRSPWDGARGAVHKDHPGQGLDSSAYQIKRSVIIKRILWIIFYLACYPFLRLIMVGT